MKIKDLMASDLEVVEPGMSLVQASQIMSDADIGSIPVVDDGEPVGILTDRDIVVRGIAEGLSPAETKVESVMTKDVVCCHADDDVESAKELMRRRQVRRVVVVDADGKVCGIVSVGDLVNAGEAAQDVLREVSRAATNGELPGKGDGVVDGLVRDELSAIETYKQALDKVGDNEGAIELRRIENEHEEAARLLQELLTRRDAEIPESSGLWGTWAKAVEGTAKVFGNKAAIKALKEGEEHGIRDYEDALQDQTLDAEIKELISTNLLPMTRAHVPILDKFLGGRGR